MNAAAGPATDVLYVQGDTGSHRNTFVHSDQVILVSMLKPPAGGNGRFVLHADEGVDIGTSCFPFLLTEGATPVIVANNLGKSGILGSSNFFGTATEDPERASTNLFYLNTIPIGTILTFSGLIVDPGSESTKGKSVTNSVVVTFVP